MKRNQAILISILFLGMICLFLDACAPSATSSRDESAGEGEATEALPPPAEYEMDEEYTMEEKAEEPLLEAEDNQSAILKERELADRAKRDQKPKPDTEEYDAIIENPFLPVVEEPLSTFSIDVDNAAYSNVRRFINQSQLPPPYAVRIEEMINYFTYDYPQPKGDVPFSINTEVGVCPWNTENQLIHIGLQGKALNYRDLKACNLVFLVDASGSMEDPNKLPLLKKSLGLLLDELGKQDKIAIVAYAGAAGLVLPSTSAKQKSQILGALDELQAGGSTAGGEGIELAYKIAKENLIPGGNNRVILATDGDFNVGQTDNKALVQLIEE
ncbi:MAG: von Willebrand factor type A domain-containing protein, partial [Bacteroidota bacterium]